MTQVHEQTVSSKQSRNRERSKPLAPAASLPNAKPPPETETKALSALIKTQISAAEGTVHQTISSTQTSAHKSAVLFVSGIFPKPRSPLKFSKSDLEDLEWRLGL